MRVTYESLVTYECEVDLGHQAVDVWVVVVVAEDEQCVLDVSRAAQRVDQVAQVVDTVMHLHHHHDGGATRRRQVEPVEVGDALRGIRAGDVLANRGPVVGGNGGGVGVVEDRWRRLAGVSVRHRAVRRLVHHQVEVRHSAELVGWGPRAQPSGVERGGREAGVVVVDQRPHVEEDERGGTDESKRLQPALRGHPHHQGEGRRRTQRHLPARYAISIRVAPPGEDNGRHHLAQTTGQSWVKWYRLELQWLAKTLTGF